MCQLYDRITYIIFIGVLIFYSLGNSIKNLLFFFIFDDFCSFVRQNKVSIDSNIYILKLRYANPLKIKLKNK